MSYQDHPLWRRPRHHEDVDEDNDHVHWVELFYDLIHVVTIFLLGNYLSDQHASWSAILVFAGMFTALWFAWGELSVFSSIYVSTDARHRLLMAVMITTIMFMGAAIPSIEGGGWPFFVLGLAANRLVLAVLWWRARGLDPEGAALCREMTRNYVVFAALFAVAAILPSGPSHALAVLGVIGTQAVYIAPGLSPIRHERFAPRLGHMAERFALLTLIVIGEAFFKLVVTLSEKGVDKVAPDVFVNFGIGAMATFGLAWLYFDLVGNARPRDESRSTLVNWWLAHLALMMCAVMIGTALAGEVYVGFWEPFPTEYAKVGCLGLAGYLAALWAIQRVTEPRRVDVFATGGVRLFGIVLALVSYAIAPFVPALVGNLVWGTALASQIVVPMWRAANERRAPTLE